MNFLQTITSSVTGEIIIHAGETTNRWLGISIFLFFLLTILVITTTLKSKRVKKQEIIIKRLRKKIKKLEDL